MSEYVKINAVDSADIVKVNGVEKADIVNIDGCTTPSAGATRWVAATQNGYLAYAANSDLTSWTAYDAYDESGSDGAAQNSGDSESVAYGKNNSGAAIYIATRATQSSGTQIRELTISGTDVTANSEWTNIDLDGSSSKAAIMQVLWGARSNGATAGTWIAVGKQGSGNIYRSTDGGANWSAVDISGLSGHLSGHANQPYLNGVASNGSGAWMTGQANRIYYSTDDGASWAVSTPFSSNAPGRFQGIVYTNNSWVICYSRQSGIRYRSCAASDITDWGDEVDGVNVAHTTTQGRGAKMAAANGNVCVAMESDLDVNRFSVNGKVIGTVSNKALTGTGSIRSIATDGTKWVVACNDGDLHESTDNGANFTQRLDGFQADGNNALDFEGITTDVYLPL
jgi:hypothetical protein